MFENKCCNKIKNFLPGFVILIFGMLALYYSVLMIDTVEELKRLLSTDLAARSLLENIEKKETWLYWSVIAMGLSGFVLVVLNADKLARLNKINKERKLALASHNNRFFALEMARDGILMVDSDGLLSYMNKSLCSIVGIDFDDKKNFIDQDWLNIFSLSDRNIIKEDVIPNLDSEGYCFCDFSMYRDDGGVIYTELSLTKLPDGGIIGTIQDVSEKRNSENEKKALEEQFYQAQKMEAIGRLAGGIAHDFNNILAAMNGYAEFLIDDLDEKSDQHKFAFNILQAGKQARSLVDQMLAFSRRNDMSCETFDMIVCAKEVVSMLHATVPKTIELNDKFLINNALVTGNSTQISQLIMNLCVNAQDAIDDEHGKIDIVIDKTLAQDIDAEAIIKDELPNADDSPLLKIEDMEDAAHTRLSLGHVMKGHEYAHLSVSDTGSGMSRVIMEHIFEPFFTTKSVDEGTGLGLATVHGIVISHQGCMVINSILGQGTRFDIYIPLEDEENIDDILEISSSDTKSTPSSKHILIVDDEENVRGVMMEMLKRLGYKASFAKSGLHGLDMIRENPAEYSLIITDYNMPEMTGLEMAQQVFMDFPDMPFIMLTGYSEDKMKSIIDGHRAIKSIIRKPASRERVAREISKILQ